MLHADEHVVQMSYFAGAARANGSFSGIGKLAPKRGVNAVACSVEAGGPGMSEAVDLSMRRRPFQLLHCQRCQASDALPKSCNSEASGLFGSALYDYPVLSLLPPGQVGALRQLSAKVQPGRHNILHRRRSRTVCAGSGAKQ